MLALSDLSEAEIDWYEERAAIYEYEANMSRREAEVKALNDIEKKRRLL